MKGLIYKDIALFFKGFNKMTLIALAFLTVILLIGDSGIYGGFFASTMLAMITGIQNINIFCIDEKTDWKKYQLSMPLSAFSVVTGKYISIICTLLVSLGGSILFNLLSSIIFQDFNMLIWKISMIISIILPLLWTAVCIPLTYWFGYNSARIIGLIAVFPVFYAVKYFEDEAGFSVMPAYIHSYTIPAAMTVIIIFIASMIISIIGYNRKKL